VGTGTFPTGHPPNRKRDQYTVSDRDRLAVAFGILALAGAVAFPATATADPDDAPPPAPTIPADPLQQPPPGPPLPVLGTPLGPAGLNVLEQAGQEPAAGALGLPQGTVGLDPTSLLGQNAVPSAPGAGPGTVPNFNVFNNAYGAGALNVKPAAPGQGQQFGVAPGDENADVSRRQWFGRYIDEQRDGRLYGGLGQYPQDQLGQPLPGTAPPPGTNIPPGLVQYLPDPADTPPGTPPPAG
jgi:hypothetical protein